MSKYSYPPLEGTGKRPVRSAADQSLRGLGLVVRYHVRQWEARGESRGKGEASAGAGGDRRTGHRAEDEGGNLGTGGGEAFAEQVQVPV